MQEFIANNWELVIGGVFTAATILATIRHNLKTISEKIDRQTRHIDDRFDALNAKDSEHDAKLSEHSVRLVKVETKVEHHTGWMKEIRDTVRDIHKRIMEGNV